MRHLTKRIAGFSLKKRDHLSPGSIDKEEEIAQPQESYQRKATSSFPLSFAQQRLWYFDQLVPNSFVYNIPAAIRLTGKLDVDALEQSLNQIIRRHETLRASFKIEKAQPVQIVTPVVHLALARIDLRPLPETEQEEGVQHLAVQEMHQAFDLAQSPLLRASLLQLGEEEHVLLLIMHHIISDSWSLKVFLHELAILYQSFTSQKATLLPDLPIQYADFTVQQRQWLQTEETKTQLAYWKQQLAGTSPVLQLPTDRSRPAVQSFQGAYYTFQLSGVLTEALKALSQREGVTLFMTLLAAVNALLFRYTRQDDIIVGTPVANRTRTELEGLIGFFANTLVLHTDLSGDPRFVEVLGRVREVALEAYAHQDLPFERLVEEVRPEGDLSYHPLFQVMAVMQDATMEVLELAGLTLMPLQIESKTTPFDIAFEFSEMPEGLGGRLVYSTDLFDATTIARLVGHLQTLLEGIVAHPEQRIGELALLTEAERQQLLVEWNDTRSDYPADTCIYQLFEAQVEQTPEAIAVVFENEHLTYRQLNRRANQLAHTLQRLGVGPESLVGVCMERSIEMVVALIGIPKAGGAYVPLDPTYPRDRLEYMIQDAQLSVLLTQERLLAALPEKEGTVIISLDTGIDWDDARGEWDANGVSHVLPDNVIYMIYTSGSTGKPKGVMNFHRSLTNRLWWMRQTYHLTPEDRVMQKTPFSFDISFWEFFWPLTTGACLIVARPGGHQDPAYLAALIAEQQITNIHFVPSMLQAFLMEPHLEQCKSLKRVFCSGEALSFDAQQRFFSRFNATELHNLYGPTEAAIEVTYWQCIPGSKDWTVPIGRPIANTQIYILDSAMQPVPIGVAGELYIGGVNVACGYYRRPELTAEKFIHDPFNPEPGMRLFKTGDLARYRADGSIEFLGRIDYQVKIRGFRVELGEIEAVLSQHPTVEECVVVAQDDARGNKRLVAYVVARKESTSPIADLRRFLKEQLPDYMLPAAFVLLEAFPLTPNGKIDRKALPLPDITDVVRDGAIATPTTPTEKRLVDIVAPLLGLEQVGIDDNFFLIGGNSLMGMQLVVQVAETFGIDFPLRTLFNAPTVRQLASEIEQLILARLQTMSEDEARDLLEKASSAS